MEHMNALAYFVSAYFHQDWDTDGGTVPDSVAQFLSEPAELTNACADHIDELVRLGMPEGELRQQLDAWGCDYQAGDTDDDYRRWLVDVRDQILAPAA